MCDSEFNLEKYKGWVGERSFWLSNLLTEKQIGAYTKNEIRKKQVFLQKKKQKHTKKKQCMIVSNSVVNKQVLN